MKKGDDIIKIVIRNKIVAGTLKEVQGKIQNTLRGLKADNIIFTNLVSNGKNHAREDTVIAQIYFEKEIEEKAVEEETDVA